MYDRFGSNSRGSFVGIWDRQSNRGHSSHMSSWPLTPSVNFVGTASWAGRIPSEKFIRRNPSCEIPLLHPLGPSPSGEFSQEPLGKRILITPPKPPPAQRTRPVQ
jgi:hypothetical protein